MKFIFIMKTLCTFFLSVVIVFAQYYSLGQKNVEIIFPQSHENFIRNLFFFDNDKKIVTISPDAIKIWDLQHGGKQIYNLTGHTQAIEGASINERTERLVSCSSDSTIRVWNLKMQTLEKNIRWTFGMPIRTKVSIQENLVWITSMHSDFLGEHRYYLSLLDILNNKIVKRIELGSGSFQGIDFFETKGFFICNINKKIKIYFINNFSHVEGTNNNFDVGYYSKFEIVNDFFTARMTDGALRVMKPTVWKETEYQDIYIPALQEPFYNDILKISESELIAIGGSHKENKGFIQLLNEKNISKIIDKSIVSEFFVDEYVSSANISKSKEIIAIAGHSIHLYRNQKFTGSSFKTIDVKNNNIDDFDIIGSQNEIVFSQRIGKKTSKLNSYDSDLEKGIVREPRTIDKGKVNLTFLNLKNVKLKNFDLKNEYAIRNINYIQQEKKLLLGDDNGSILLWNTQNENIDINYEIDESAINTILYNQKNKEFYVGLDNNKLNIYKLNDNQIYKSFILKSHLNSIANNINHSLIVLGNNDINIFDIQRNKFLKAYSSIGQETELKINKVQINDENSYLRNFAESFGKLLPNELNKKDKINKIVWEGDNILWGGEDGFIYFLDHQNGLLKKRISNNGDHILDIEISPDKKILAVSTGFYNKHLTYRNVTSMSIKGKINLYTFPELKPITYLGEHNTSISKIKFSDDSRILYSLSSEDGNIKAWDIIKKSLKYSYINLRDNNWVIFTPDNYYLSSIGGVKDINFKLDNKLYNFDQFDLYFNRPDIVLERIGLASQETIEQLRKAYEKRVERMGFKPQDLKLDFEQPDVSIVENDFPVSTTNQLLKFNIEASDAKYKLDRINVYINDVPIYGTKGFNIKSQNVNSIKKVIDVLLSAGKNKIEVSAHGQNGVESKRESFEISYQTPPRKPSLYVISIGVSEYKNPEKPLKYAAKDASDIAELFDASKNAYSKVETITLKNQEVTKEKILEIKQKLALSGVDDKVILFISGHGILDNQRKNWYYATQDMDFDNPSSKGISYGDLEGLLDGIPARNKLFLLDACHSGELDTEQSKFAKNEKSAKEKVFNKGNTENMAVSPLESSIEAMKIYFVDIRRFSGSNVISAARGYESAYEGRENEVYKNGYFTYAFIDGIKSKKADKDKDGVVKISELSEYVHAKVVEISGNTQVPTNRQENLENDFVIWTY